MVFSLDHDDRSSFDILGNEECVSLLEKTNFGRVVVTIGALPAVFPVNYASVAGVIYFLSGEGTKLSAALRNQAVAFQIDSIDSTRRQGWSVQAVGLAQHVESEEAAYLRERLELEPCVPGAREHLVRIRPDLLSGRRIGGPHTLSSPWQPDVGT